MPDVSSKHTNLSHFTTVTFSVILHEEVCWLLCKLKKRHQNAPSKIPPCPNSEWSDLSAEFLGPLPSREYLLVVNDECSRFRLRSFASTTWSWTWRHSETYSFRISARWHAWTTVTQSSLVSTPTVQQQYGSSWMSNRHRVMMLWPVAERNVIICWYTC